MPLGSCLPVGTVPSPQMKTPELPPAVRCFHSTDRMKFSYCRSVRMTPIGLPLHTIMPSRTLHVSGAQFTLTHPDRSLPLNRSRICRGSWDHAGAQQTNTPAMHIITFVGF